MFTTEDLLAMDEYREFLYVDDRAIEMQSRNTQHYWAILIDGPRAYRCLHKHRADEQYHPQWAFLTLFDVVLSIVSHDEYQLRGRKPIKYVHQARNLFSDQLIAQYPLDPYEIGED